MVEQPRNDRATIFHRIDAHGGATIDDIKRVVSHDTDQRMEYQSRHTKDKSSIMHCGQLKLMCMETSFLTDWAAKGDLVVYVGGGNGLHLPTLARMFPMLSFDVYDVQRISPDILAETAGQFRFVAPRHTEADGPLDRE